MSSSKKKPPLRLQTLVSLCLPPILVAYALYGLSQDELHLLGRYRPIGYFHGAAAMCESAMLFSLAAALSCDAFLAIYHRHTKASGKATLNRLHLIKPILIILTVTLFLLGLILKFADEGLPWQKQPQELNKIPPAPVAPST